MYACKLNETGQSILRFCGILGTKLLSEERRERVGESGSYFGGERSSLSRLEYSEVAEGGALSFTCSTSDPMLTRLLLSKPASSPSPPILSARESPCAAFE